MNEDLASYELIDEVAVIRLSDPATLNAFSVPMIRQVRAGMERAIGEARAIVLTGTGRSFSSGANLSGPMAMAPPEERDAGAGLESDFNPFMLWLRELPLPFITAVNGAAVGVGCSIALAGDLVIAAESAFFLLAFARVGLVPDSGATYLLPKTIGRARAMEMMMLGDRIGARQALEWGLINRVAPDQELEVAALTLGKRLAEGPVEALGRIRSLAWSGLELPLGQQLDLERIAQRDAGRAPEFQEGAAAFREKRAPRFFRRSSGRKG